jgi:hypothetical protein
MANEQNLIRPEELNARLTPEQRRENTSKAGIASGKARRAKRDRHKRIQELFALAVKDPKLKANLEKMGIDVTDADLETAADARVMVELLRKGDYKAWQAMKQEAYPEDHQIEIADGVKSITINIKRYDADGE